uniref:Uncharacterized protein n=1 Tax=Anguilla anguilla TaxID=7936 RepID=A0A0E9RXB0_ANGAN
MAALDLRAVCYPNASC